MTTPAPRHTGGAGVVRLPPVPLGREAAVAWVANHLADLVRGPVIESRSFVGGQVAADAALATLDITGYAGTRNQVHPPSARGATRLSPYIRHGLLTLPQVWQAVAGAPDHDLTKFRDELLWQEYARHLYARLGRATGRSLRFGVEERGDVRDLEAGWPQDMECLRATTDELVDDGWLPNQARLWLAAHWAVRHGHGWRDGEDLFHAHLLDGSRAANRAGWQWTVGALTGRPYGFSRHQVRLRAPELCEACPLADACPIDDRGDVDEPTARALVDPRLRRDPDVATTRGPARTESAADPDTVLLTFESLGSDDPALRAHPDLPVLVIFDEPLLHRLRLAGPRLVFLAQTLAELGAERSLTIMRGRPAEAVRDRAIAVTFAPVPGFARLAASQPPAALHPWPWLRTPHGGPLTSFTAWRRHGRF